jgi:putative transposase
LKIVSAGLPVVVVAVLSRPHLGLSSVLVVMPKLVVIRACFAVTATATSCVAFLFGARFGWAWPGSVVALWDDKEMQPPDDRRLKPSTRHPTETARGTKVTRLLNEGQDLVEVLRHLEVSEATFNRWRAVYGGMKADEAKRLKTLEAENQRLKKLVVEQALDIDMLKELAEGKF